MEDVWRSEGPSNFRSCRRGGKRFWEECLLVQLKHPGEENSIARSNFQNHLKQLQNKHYQEISVP